MAVSLTKMPTVVRLAPLGFHEAVAAAITGAARLIVYRLAVRLGVDIYRSPLNGQQLRAEAIAAIADDFAPDAVIETGTWLGDSTGHFAGFAPMVFSAELNPSFVMSARIRLHGRENVTLALGDSRQALRYVAQHGLATKPLIYLDAHWYKDLPLAEEIEIIAQNWKDAILVIDDFTVPDDPGYQFDKYGGKRIDLAYCGFGPEYTPFFPAQSSDDETGLARGTCYVGLRDGRATLDRLVDMGVLRTA